MKSDDPKAAIGKRERSKIEKRARIKDVADRLFREKGYEETTTSQISRAAGIATGTLFLYYASKDELLIELFADRIRERIASFAASFDAGGDPAEQLNEFFLAMIMLHEEDPRLNRHFIRAIAIIADRRIAHDVNNLARSANLAIARAIIALQRAGRLDRGFSPRTAAQVLFGTYFTSLVEWANGGIDVPQVHSRIRSSTELVIQALSLKI